MDAYPIDPEAYAQRTAHLTDAQDLAFRRLLDLYYAREQPLPVDVAEVARLIRMDGHGRDVLRVLIEFFVETPEGWRSASCDADIANAKRRRRP